MAGKRRAEVYCPDCQVSGLHVHAVTFVDGRRVVGQPAISEAVREWSRKPEVARVFGQLIAQADAQKREQMAVDAPETEIRPERRVS